MEIILATNNLGKVQEFKSLLSTNFKLTTLQDQGIFEDIPEPFHTFKENAWAKANYVFEKTGKTCLAEDSGLVVPALNNEPGVFSARYAGAKANDKSNNEKLIKNIQQIQDKSAYYQTVICLILNGTTHYFNGACHGTITIHPRGMQGFGYDPLFIPEGSDKTFAEFDLVEKNKISHRGKAVKALTAFLNSSL